MMKRLIWACFRHENRHGICARWRIPSVVRKVVQYSSKRVLSPERDRLIEQYKLWSSAKTNEDISYEDDDQDHSHLFLEPNSQLVVHQGYGVVEEDKDADLHHLVRNFTAPALAAALRDREQTLHHAAGLLRDGKDEELRLLLEPYEVTHIRRRRRIKRDIDVSEGFQKKHLHMLRKYLHRMPRHISRQTQRRASVVIPLCNVGGVPAVLFTKRSSTLNKHAGQVCFPGGNVDDQDDNIVETSLREMEEEIGIPGSSVEILGVLRCDWSEIAAIVGMAVTPVVGFVHDLRREHLRPNPDEVATCFAVPLPDLLHAEAWSRRDHMAPVFTGGPHVVWGLTAYILDKFLQDVLLQYRVNLGKSTDLSFRRTKKTTTVGQAKTAAVLHATKAQGVEVDLKRSKGADVLLQPSGLHNENDEGGNAIWKGEVKGNLKFPQELSKGRMVPPC